MTTATFDPAIAAETAARAIRERLVEVRDQAEAEAMVALSAVEGYAKHLAADGDPREGFTRERAYSNGPQYVRAVSAVESVYRAWAEARGSRNPFSPINEQRDWEIAEYALARVGEPVTFATYRDEVTSATRRATSTQSDDVAKALAACQGDDLVLRRTKVGGKVAYLLRERQEGEEFVGRLWEDGRVSCDASKVPEERWPAS